MLKKNKLIIDLSALIVVVAGIIIANLMINANRRRSFYIENDSNECAYQIEDAFIDGDDLVIKGWFFELKKIANLEHETHEKNDSGIIIYDLGSAEKEKLDGTMPQKKGVILDVLKESRPDINMYFDCEYDYSDCGFLAKTDKSKIDMEKGCYQIVIKRDIDSEWGMSMAYLVNGKIQYTNPLNEMRLNVEGTDLEDIVNNGVCVVSYPEYHICVYQYGWKLYWIADEKYSFEEDGSTYIQYQLDTTQFDKLPDDRIANGWYWSNIGADFESNEITAEMNCGQYRVCTRDIPKEYSVVRITTGYHIGDWVWLSFFRPDYRLLNK